MLMLKNSASALNAWVGAQNLKKAGRLKRLEAKFVKKSASYRDYVET